MPSRKSNAKPSSSSPETPSPPLEELLDQQCTREFSATWMKKWVDTASQGLSVIEACKTAEVTVRHYQDGRLQDLEFDEECRAYDQTVDLRIGEALRSRALDGDPRALSLYYSRVRVVYLPPKNDAERKNNMTPEIAAAMLHAGLEAYRKSLPDDPSFDIGGPLED